MVDTYHKVYEQVWNEQSSDNIHAFHEDMPSEMIDEMIDKAERELVDSPDPHELSEQYTELAGDKTATRRKNMSLAQEVEDVIGSRVLEQLAGSGACSLSYSSN